MISRPSEMTWEKGTCCDWLGRGAPKRIAKALWGIIMPNYALLTASGLDRPGIVAGITGVLLESDCNIEDSQMSHFLGQEAGIGLLVGNGDA